MKDEYKEMVCRVRFIDGVPAKTYLSDVEIVRCKDCAKCGTDDCAMRFETDDKVYQWNRADDFCSLGRKKE